MRGYRTSLSLDRNRREKLMILRKGEGKASARQEALGISLQ